MKKTSSIHFRFSKAGIDAVKLIHSNTPHLDRSPAIEAFLISQATKSAAARPLESNLINASDLLLLVSESKALEKLHTSRRNALIKRGDKNGMNILEDSAIELEQCKVQRKRIADLANLSQDITSEEVEAFENIVNRLLANLKNSTDEELHRLAKLLPSLLKKLKKT